MKKIKQLLCKHKFKLVIDLDSIVNNKGTRGTCCRCGKSYKIDLTTISMFEDFEVKPETRNGCTKRAYTKQEAITQLNRVRKLRRKRRAERYYECPTCNKYHLTSKE